jgi:uncharacterized protein YoaH (UPF0181 family)
MLHEQAAAIERIADKRYSRMCAEGTSEHLAAASIAKMLRNKAVEHEQKRPFIAEWCNILADAYGMSMGPIQKTKCAAIEGTDAKKLLMSDTTPLTP